jgi:phosphotriesterase-related protein
MTTFHGKGSPMTDRNRERLGRREALGLLGLGAGYLAWGAELDVAAAFAQTRPQKIPRKAVIRTVLEDISPNKLRGGATLMHEHLVGGFYSSPPRPAPAPPNPGGRGAQAPGRGAQGGQTGRGQQAAAPPRGDTPETVDLIVEELKASKRDGLNGIVDASIGRRTDQSIELLKTIATRSGVHVIVAGGYYRAPYPPRVASRSENDIAEEMVQDAKSQRWGAFGEIGSSMETHPDERKMMRAVAKAHLRTGLPIFTHTPHESCGKCALDQIELYEEQQVNPAHLCIGHLSDLKDDPTAQTPIAIARRGAFLGFDTVGHELNVSRSTNVTDRIKLQMVLAVLEAGYENQLLLSSDMAHNNHLKANWGEGFSAVLVTFVGKLRYAGVKESTIRKILHDNPRRFLAFEPKI